MNFRMWESVRLRKASISFIDSSKAAKMVVITRSMARRQAEQAAAKAAQEQHEEFVDAAMAAYHFNKFKNRSQDELNRAVVKDMAYCKALLNTLEKIRDRESRIIIIASVFDYLIENNYIMASKPSFRDTVRIVSDRIGQEECAINNNDIQQCLAKLRIVLRLLPRHPYYVA
jgi:predicted membrane chloride channel (bestrophin family)